MPRLSFVVVVFVIQAFCAVFFVSDIVFSVIGIRARPISWQTREFLEIGAALGLILGVGLGWLAFRRTLARSHRAERQLRVASGAFMELLEESFDDWGLTPAERDVALFSIKGLSVADIAELRGTSEGTVKAQTNAIYRKAGVSGRPQLLSIFIEDLMGDTLVEGESKTSAP
ncbi:helix-turn-helix transcriptional regulator [Alisedimentitalea sp. MJ-SS2]|uniref:helix-turn-helix transcriptional regulator n=1 Tax=Aliisedimentitalea sp. MJ-SS2 TaxID=3049795 RepID=UPI002912F5F7|nr:helix-turn-helix transcriptional regulator [Alisedimentitalea sp. MJ-SS2]MDU8926020.1 helix-turn-helix transcriptional regulator [Alisedimentitalea sp. MJ-SS2]